jgi:hypothetical protein
MEIPFAARAELRYRRNYLCTARGNKTGIALPEMVATAILDAISL